MAKDLTLEQIRKQEYGKKQTFQNFAFAVNRDEDIDAEARTVKLAFASTNPIDNWYYGAIKLNFDKKAVRADRLKNGLAVLMDHNTRDQIGVVIDYSFDSDGIARATVLFHDDQRSEDIFRSIQTGIRRHVSVGFMIWQLDLESKGKDKPSVYVANDWEPYEISIVAVPADTAAGVGRELDEDPAPPVQTVKVKLELDTEDAERQLEELSEASQTRAISNKEENKMTPEEIAAEEAKNKRSAVLVIADEIREWGKVLQCDTLATEYLREAALATTGDGVTVDGFKAYVREKQPKPTAIPPRDPADVARENGVDVRLATVSYRGGALKSFKGEGHLERAHRAGMFYLAALGRNARALAFCQEKGMIRAHSGELNSTGGVLVPDELDQNIIDLRIQYGTFRRNANVAVMASDTLIRPRRTGGLTAYFTGGGDAATESTKGWDSITLMAKKLSVLTKYENELSEDAVINIADDLTSEIAYAFANKEDECGFNGTGTDTYGGMVGVCQKILGLSATRANIAGLQVASGNAWSEITIGDLQGVVGRLPQFARQSGNVKWYCSHEFYATVLMRLAQAVGGVTATEIQNGFGPSFFGIPVEIVEVMPHSEANDTVCLLYGNLAQAATLGDRRGTSIAMTDSDSTDFAKGIMAIRGDTRFDINVHDVGNAHGTAANRTPGPIVGLLTAAS